MEEIEKRLAALEKDMEDYKIKTQSLFEVLPVINKKFVDVEEKSIAFIEKCMKTIIESFVVEDSEIPTTNNVSN